MTARNAVDGLQQRIASYASALSCAELTAETNQAAKVRVIDTLGSLIGGFDGEPCRIARRMASRLADPEGATIVGTASKTTPSMAAFANATAARYVEMNDVYHWPGSAGGHPSDVAPVPAGFSRNQPTRSV
jgi:2-methylcitrate dehydratase